MLKISVLSQLGIVLIFLLRQPSMTKFMFTFEPSFNWRTSHRRRFWRLVRYEENEYFTDEMEITK